MLNSIKLLLCICALIFSLPLAAVNRAEAAPQLQPQQIDQVKAYIEEQFTKAKLVGGSFVLFQQDDIVWADGLGYANKATKQEAEPNTVYSIASITKVMTAAAILKLAEEQLVNLDAPVTDYIPWFHYKDAEQSARVTVRHLLTHSAGINRFSADGAIYQDIRNNRNSLENAAKSLQNVRMNKEPGTAGQYCNTCYNVLGLIIEAVTEQKYENYMQDWFESLGMQQTTFAPYQLPTEEVAKEYGYLFGFQTEVKPYWKEFGSSQAPEGGAYSSALDLANWTMKMLASAASPAAFEDGVKAIDLSNTVYTESGFERTIHHETPVLAKSGDGMGASSFMAYIPSQQMGFVLLVGEADGEATKTIGEGVIELLLGFSASSVGFLNAMQVLGYISLGLAIISLDIILMLIRSILRLRQNEGLIKRRWTVVLRLIINLLLCTPVWWLLLNVRPTEAGFYGYPYDLAVALIAFAVSTSLWVIYSLYCLFLRKEAA